MGKRVWCMLLLLLLLTSCGAMQSEATASSYSTFAFIYKNEGNLYGDREMEGFSNAISEMGGTHLLLVPASGSADSQVPFIQELVDKKVDAIALAANDYDLLEPYLQKAMETGIKVLSADSAVNPNSRMLHVAQADNSAIADHLIRAAYEMCEYEGNVAIVSTTPYMGNQATWIDHMERQLQQSPYDMLTLVDIVYGDDELQKSIQVTRELLQNHPEIDVIIAPTVMGICGASQVVREMGLTGQVKVTGLGLPSMMVEYIEDGTCPWMYLWNPEEIGYLTGYAAVALVEGSVKGEVGERFSANRLGTFTITQAEDGGTEVILGVPLKFDIDNIDEWKDAY